MIPSSAAHPPPIHRSVTAGLLPAYRPQPALARRPSLIRSTTLPSVPPALSRPRLHYTLSAGPEPATHHLPASTTSRPRYTPATHGQPPISCRDFILGQTPPPATWPDLAQIIRSHTSLTPQLPGSSTHGQPYSATHGSTPPAGPRRRPTGHRRFLHYHNLLRGHASLTPQRPGSSTHRQPYSATHGTTPPAGPRRGRRSQSALQPGVHRWPSSPALIAGLLLGQSPSLIAGLHRQPSTPALIAGPLTRYTAKSGPLPDRYPLYLQPSSPALIINPHRQPS